MTYVLIRRQSCEGTETQGEHHVITKAETGIFQVEVNKECQRLPVNYQKLGRGKDGFPYRFQRKQGPNDTLISDF